MSFLVYLTKMCLGFAVGQTLAACVVMLSAVHYGPLLGPVAAPYNDT